MSTRGNLSSKACCFCNLKEDNELEYGKFHEYNGIVTHYYCLLLSSNMEQKGNDDEGILGFLTEDIQKELRRGKRLVCSYCKKIGATLGCCNVRCKRIFHFPCGLKNGSLHQYFGQFRSYCINHRPKQQIDEYILKQIKPVDNILCYICYDQVIPSDFVKTLWAPCCKKNAFFHRKCVQQLALSAGYFFKCPLCNNNTDFRNAMLEYGIFIPSQDASWELVPNAFEELLYRHNQCDAVKCLCPKGRKHVSSNAKWELTLCRICGSQGIHKACGQLKWANPIWECAECTSILNSSKNNEDTESDDNSDGSSRDSGSDSNSDTDISVGMDLPMPHRSPSISPNSTLISMPDSTSDIRLRPGPRSFKLYQRAMKWLKLTREFYEKYNISNNTVNQDTNTSPKNNDKEKSLTNNENNIQEKKLVSSNDKQVTPQTIGKEADVITIESDDEVDNEVEIITLKRRTDLSTPLQLTSQSSISYVSSSMTNIIKSELNTVNNLESKSSNVTLTNFLEKDDKLHHLQQIAKSIESKSEILRKNFKQKSTNSEQFDVTDLATSRESMPDTIISNSNDLDDLDIVDVSGSPMNIKITNVTSLPPEVFENVPDIALHKNSIDTSSPSTSKLSEKCNAPSKRMYEEASSIASNCKKIKRDNLEKTGEKNVMAFCDIIASNANEQQNGKISPTKINEIHENKNLLKCTSILPLKSTNVLSNLYNNQKADLSTQFMSFNKTDDVTCSSQVAANYSKGNVLSHDLQQHNEKTKKTYLPASNKRKDQVYSSKLTVGNHPTSMLDPNLIINQYGGSSKNKYFTPSNSVPIMTNDVAMINQPQTIVVNQSVALDATMPIIANGNQTNVLDNKKTALMTEKIFSDVSNPGNNSYTTNNIFCDGDAGTYPAKSISRKKTDPSSKFCGRMDSSNAIESHTPVATRSVFPEVTNNHSTCHQPRLIPQYMNLQDLKFRVCKPDNVQMVLYDTFSVNIPIKNSSKKESKTRSANVIAQRKSKELCYPAPSEASSSVDYVDDIQSGEQQFIKFFRSLKNENLINDKTKYVVCDGDDAKENLDPVRSKMLLRNDDNSLVNDIDETMTIHDSFCGEINNEVRFVSSDTNLSALNRTICNINVVDSAIDGTVFVSNDCNQTLQVNWEDVQQHKQISAYDKMPAPTEEKNARSFCKETNRIVYNVDFDFNTTKTNKNIEKLLQDDITVSTNQHNRDNNKKINNDHIDDFQTMLWNNCKHLDNTNIIRIPNRSATRVSNIMFNEHSILNKQIDASDSVKFIRRLTFDENYIINRNSENNFGHNNSESCLKVSIDLCKIQSLIDSKPELFVKRM